MGELKKVAVSEIRENPVALRTVNRESEEYMGLVDSIREKGFLGAITVRPKTDEETGQTYYELVDGLHRFCATKDAGFEEINVDVVSLDDAQVLEGQLMLNIHKVETRPIEYSRQLTRILVLNPLLTEAELASKLGKSPQWISERLGLTKIANENIALLVNEGKIKLANAYALAKLPPDEMASFVDRAMTQPPDEFLPAVNARIKEIKEAKRKGLDAAPQEFQPVAFMQKMKDIKEELENRQVGAALIRATGVATPEDAFHLAIQWVLHLDVKSVSVQKAKDDERAKVREVAVEKRKEEKTKKLKEKADKAAAEAAKAMEALANANA
jgi:ParB family chromosome partitioning protein